jgi:hypothetical protein
MGKFGWSYPPGVTGNEPEISGYELPCEVCGHEAGDCICPECPACGATGDPLCYEQHGLVRSQPDPHCGPVPLGRTSPEP